MRNAAVYHKKIAKLLSGIPRERSGAPREAPDPVRVLIRSVLEADATRKQAEQALAALEEEFVDFNEMRVAPPKEIAERLGKDFPRQREKAEMLVSSLGRIFNRSHQISMEYMAGMTRRDLRRHLREIGLDAYSAAAVVLRGFGGHAIPVDRTLVECLEMQGCVRPGSDVGEVQGFLERVIALKDAVAAHEFFRSYVERLAKPLAKKRKAEAVVEKAEAKAAAKQAHAAARAAAKQQAAAPAAEAAGPPAPPAPAEAAKPQPPAKAKAARPPKAAPPRKGRPRPRAAKSGRKPRPASPRRRA